MHRNERNGTSALVDYYFDVFLQDERKVRIGDYVKEIERYNECLRESRQQGEHTFFIETDRKYPEFRALFRKHHKEKDAPALDLVDFLLKHSEFLNKEENKWMQTIMQIVHKTSLYFQPQIRSKIMNEGWASYWHETLFLQDDRIKGHEVDFARVNSAVTSMPRVGLNPYALGMRLFYYIEESANRGRYSRDFLGLRNI